MIERGDEIQEVQVQDVQALEVEPSSFIRPRRGAQPQCQGRGMTTERKKEDARNIYIPRG